MRSGGLEVKAWDGYTITWIQVWCPRCETSNMVRLGNLEDQTVDDVTHVRCRGCGEVWPIVDLIEEESFPKTEVEGKSVAP